MHEVRPLSGAPHELCLQGGATLHLQLVVRHTHTVRVGLDVQLEDSVGSERLPRHLIVVATEED